MGLKFNIFTGTLDIAGGAGGIGATNATDNAIVRFDTTSGDIQGYTSNAPTITDNGLATFNDGTTKTEMIGALSQNTGRESTQYGYLTRNLTGDRVVLIGTNSLSTGSDNVGIGWGANCRGIRGTTIGRGSYLDNGTVSAAALGYLARVDATGGVAVGASSRIYSTGTNAFCMGNGSGAYQSGGVSVGNLSRSGVSTSTSGVGGIAIGDRAITDHSSVVFGSNSLTTDHYQFVVGGVSNPNYWAQDLFLGCSPDGLSSGTLNEIGATPQTVNFINAEDGQTNRSMNDIEFRGQAGTGTGAGGGLVFKTAPASTTGSTRNSHVEVARFTPDNETILSGSIHKPIRTITASASLNSSDYTVLGDATSGDITITLPAATTCTGRTYNIKKKDASANLVIIDGNGAETIDGGLTTSITTQYESITIQCDGSNWWII